MKVLVIGFGVSGRAAVELLDAQGAEVVVHDDRPIERPPAGIETHTGTWERRLLDGVDLVVPSPGVPETSEVLGDARHAGVPVWSELELGYRAHGDATVLAVTGTNGKTTVTEMATAMLQASGIDAVAVGNIGDPISTAPPAEVLVVEASSFQLRFIDTFAPNAAVITNFAPDHLDWHESVAAYGAAKARIVEHAGPETPLIFDADDAGAAGLVAGIEARLVEVGAATIGSAGDDDHVVLGGTAVAVSALPRADRVLITDLALSAAAAAEVGATPGGIEQAAATYQPGRHRREVVAEIRGVTFVDDSKATNPHAALAAIASYPSVVLIAGGRAKGLDIRPLATAPTVRRVIAIGESADDLLAARPDAVVASDMDAAVAEAAAFARDGDVVLLAPGCASFDMFDSYGHRGDVFASSVRARVGA